MAKNSIAGSSSYAVEAMLAAASPLPKIPDHVRVKPDVLPFLESILRARTRAEWIDSDIVVAVQLARAQLDIEIESVLLEQEGSVINNAKGTQIMNPRVSVLEQLARREMALMRTLRIGGTTAPGTKNRADLDRKRAVQHQAEQALAEVEDEDLLA